jgi:molybdate transport repressor ModE-like protein
MAAWVIILYYFAMPDKKRTARLDWEDVRYFVALARHGTLSASARALRVNHATVARRIASLETLIGRALFDRRAGGYVLTAEGKAVLDEASTMDEAAISILRRRDARTELSGLVRLAAGRVLTERFLIDRLRGFHERFPAIDLEVIGGSRIVSLAKREADVALRYGSPKDSELVARRVATITFGLYASPTCRDKPGNRRPSSVSTKRAISLPRRNGWPVSLAISDFHFAPIARRHRLPPPARVMALRFSRDTSWRRTSRTSSRFRWMSVYESAMCGF